MTEYRADTLEESKKFIGRLHDLSDFFGDPVIIKIYLQTQVIHKLFEDNPDMDVNKLELFHIQFTSTLIDLLEKIRKRNERIVAMNENEIKLNDEMITKLRKALVVEGGFDMEKQNQAQRITRSIYNLHKALSSQSTEYPFKDNINAFSLKYYKDYFFEADADLLNQLISYQNQDVYKNSFGVIGRELLNDLVKSVYKIEFFAGAKVGNTLMEIYKINNQDKYFLFLPSKNTFLPCNIELFPYKEWITESSKKERSIRDLMQKNIELERSIKQNAKNMDADIISLLDENLKKITDLDFLADLENIDIQANTLRTMLETKMI